MGGGWVSRRAVVAAKPTRVALGYNRGWGRTSRIRTSWTEMGAGMLPYIESPDEIPSGGVSP